MPRRSQWHLGYRPSVADLPNSVYDEEECTTYDLAEHSAAEIFAAAKNCGGKERQRQVTVVVDGVGIEYGLTKALNQKPKKTSAPRPLTIKNLNVNESPIFYRIRVWILKYAMCSVILGYFLCFLAVNVVFAVMWYLLEDKCCGDSTASFGEVMDFAIQTSTTLGYGGQDPVGLYSNVLVALNFFVSLTLHALFAGVVFLKFVTPSAKLEFSNIMTLSNVNGLPCLSIRVGNADGGNILLQDLKARLNFMYEIRYKDDLGKEVKMMCTQEVKLHVDWRFELKEVWTLRHIIDETSPLFGVLGVEGLQEDIRLIQVSVAGMQDVTKMHVTASSTYRLEDILVGYRFQDQMKWDPESNTLAIDYSKLNEITPHSVWYPVQKDSYPRSASIGENKEA